MGLLSSPTPTRLFKFLTVLLRFTPIIAVLLYLAGICWIVALMWPAFNQHTYFSENALLPGLVEEEFADKRAIQDHLNRLQSVAVAEESLHDHIVEALRNSRLDTFIQNFTYNHPLFSSNLLSGKNIYGIVRATRSSGTEAIVIASSYSRETLNGVAVLLALAQYCRSRVYWAKDIIFLFTDHAEYGSQAWLSAYHEIPIDYLITGGLQAHGGVIQAGVALDLRQADATSADLKYQMINGQLPNLDLFNLARKMSEKYAVETTIHRLKYPAKSFTAKGFKQFLRIAVTGLASRVLGRPTGIHSVFGQYGIEAVTLEFYNHQQGQQHSTNSVEIGRIFEGILRSINNLQERFHQSYFFYVLASPDRFISIALYMPSVGLILVGVLLLAAKLWLDMLNEIDPPLDEKVSTEGASGKGLESPEKTALSGPRARPSIKTADEDVSSSAVASVPPKEPTSDMSLFAALPTLFFSHGIGCLALYIPSLVHYLSTASAIDSAHLGDVEERKSLATMNSLLMVAVSLTAVMLTLPSLLPRKVGKLPIDYRIVKCVALLELSLVIGVAAVLNFPFGLLLGIVLVPLCLPARPYSNRLAWSTSSFVLLFGHPLVFGFLVLLIAQVWSPMKQPVDTFSALSELFKGVSKQLTTWLGALIMDCCIFRSWLYMFVSLWIVPTWLTFWSIAQMQCVPMPS